MAHSSAAGPKIYTRRGDSGRTALLGGVRVSKDDARVAAYGDVDELSATLGMAIAFAKGRGEKALLRDVQRDLLAVGAQLADPRSRIGLKRPKAALSPALVEGLERAIDERESSLPPLRQFILPGGSAPGAALHLARTVCRRAERSVVTLLRRHKVDPLVLTYLNRLSDLLFVMARHANLALATPEDRW